MFCYIFWNFKIYNFYKLNILFLKSIIINFKNEKNFILIKYLKFVKELQNLSICHKTNKMESTNRKIIIF